MIPRDPWLGRPQGAPSVTAGVYAACTKLREAVAQELGFNANEVEVTDGHGSSGNRSVPLAVAAKQGAVTVEDTMEFEKRADQHQQQTFGAHYVEVAVDACTGVVRVRRMLAVCAAGRILNAKIARSQVIGA